MGESEEAAVRRYTAVFEGMVCLAKSKGGRFSMSNFFEGFRRCFPAGKQLPLHDSDKVDTSCPGCVVTLGEFKAALSGCPVFLAFVKEQAEHAVAAASRAAAIAAAHAPVP